VSNAKKTTSVQQGAAPQAGIKSVSLDAFLEDVRDVHATTPEPERGACLVKDPKTGQSVCIRTSPEACKALKGTFVGGPCG